MDSATILRTYFVRRLMPPPLPISGDAVRPLTSISRDAVSAISGGIQWCSRGKRRSPPIFLGQRRSRKMILGQGGTVIQ